MCLVIIFLTGRSLVQSVFAAAPANIRIAHLAPFAADDTNVDIYINEILIAPGKALHQSTQYFESPTSELLVRVALSGTTTFVVSETVTLADDADYTLLIVGDGNNQPLDVVQIEDDNSAPAEGNFKLKLGHFAPFAADIEETRADIRLDDGTPILENVPFGAVGEFVELPAGVYDVKVTTPGGEITLIDVAPVEYDPGEIISLFADGDGANQNLGVFVYPSVSFGFPLSLEEIVDPEPEEARLYVAHLAPFAAEDGTSVTVRLNGTDTLTEILYGDSTGYLNVPAGEYLVEILPTGTETVAISATVNLTDGVDYTAIAVGDGANQSLAIQALVDDNSAPADGNFALRLGHLAPFADTTAATLADIRLQDGTPVLENVPFGAVNARVELPAGEYNLKITTPGGETTLIDPAAATFAEGDIVSAFAVGDGSNQDLGVFAIINGAAGVFLPLEVVEPEPETARLYVAHLAPFAAEDGTSVTVRLNGTDTLMETLYGDSTGYLNVPAGEYLVEVLPTGTETVAISATVNLTNGVDYTAIAVGDGANQGLAIQALVDNNSAPADGNFALRLGHLAPFADTTEATLADVRLQDGTPVLENVSFGAVDARIELPAGEYNLKITTPGGETTLIDPAAATFAEGDIVSAFAVGEASNQDLGVFAIINGAQGVFLPLEGDEPEPTGPRLYVAHLAPFAAGDNTSVTVRLNGTDALTEFTYGDSTGYLNLAAGEYLVEILLTDNSTVALSTTVNLTDNVDYTALAVGDGTNQSLSIQELVGDNSAPAAGNFALRLGHFAPFANTPETTLADIRLQDGTPVLENVPFGAVNTRIELPAGEYDLKITTPGGEITLIDPAPVTFAAGDVVSAFAVGEGINQELSVFAIINGAEGVFIPDAPAGGSVQIFLPVIQR